MSAFVRLDSTVDNQIGYKTYRTPLSVEGTTYSIPAAFMRVSQDPLVVVTPDIVANGAVVELRFSSWQVTAPELARTLPLRMTSMATAVEVANAFIADSGVSWSSADEDIEAWGLALKAGGR
ncbi:hypothetical protein [Saccharopolyspora sp. 6V]|uniref:hypothetical protein n=1 Tax=Saccharopolyspora sp. 6V TaxID=2877239 RepID=UPI001CD2105B|nr:hypothetical protein [Saccharopolyspora sp. 6V]MCA1191655.1 hypothetical protein [Saccharopolyspora sp. 6V]